VARHRQAAPLAGWLFQGAFASDVGVARTGFGAFALSFVLLMKTSRQEGGDSLRARREGDRAQEGDRALQIRRGPTECLDAKLGGGRHICKASTSICQVYQIANLNYKTIGGVFFSLFCKFVNAKSICKALGDALIMHHIWIFSYFLKKRQLLNIDTPSFWDVEVYILY